MRSAGRWPSAVARGLVLFAAVVAGCSGDSTGNSPTPSAIVFIGSNVLTGAAGQPLSSSLQIEIRDTRGQPLPNIAFTVAVSAGSITGTPTKTVVGTTSLGTWTLGTTAGTQTLTVTSSGLAPLVLTATAVAGPPQNVSTEGQPQTANGTPNSAAPIIPQIRVTDAVGNPIIGAPVTVVITGGGSVQFPSPTTNNNGFATVGTWTLGPTAGVQTVSMTIAGIAPVVFTVNAGGQFNIEVRYTGATPSAAIQAAFTAAVTRIRQFIIGELSDFNFNQNASGCAPGVGTVTETIDDILIFATIAPIDGVGEVLGQAGPCFLRPGGGLPLMGRMFFDSADINEILQAGLLTATITHEMMHVLGFGIPDVWVPRGLVQGLGTTNSLFIGPQAGAAYRSMGGSNPVGIALENCVGLSGCGAGTRDSHWRELAFFNELMTGFVDQGFNPISRFTVAAFADMGYGVSIDAADQYTILGGQLRVHGGVGPMHLREILLPVIGEAQEGRRGAPKGSK